MKINDELTKKIAKLAAEIMNSAEKEQGEVRSQGEADFVNQHVDNIEVVDNRDEKLGKTEEPKEKKDKKKAVKEEMEKEEEDDMEEGMMSDKEIEEALSKSTPASEWIKDFVHSKNPMFKDKSKDQRIQMALGAYYAKKNESIEEATGKLNSYVVFKDSAKKDHKIYGEFIGNEENNTAVISISGKGYTLPKQDVHHSASGMNESVKLNEAAPVKYDIWIKQLGDIVARSSDTKDLAMSFEAWSNSLYKTPLWNSIQQNPILSELISTLAEALDVYIGMSNEERKEDETKDDAEKVEEAYGDRAELQPDGSYKRVNARERDRNAGLEREVNTTSYRPSSQTKMIKIDGKVWAKDGKPLKFGPGQALSVQRKIQMKNRNAKIEIVSEGIEEATDTETSTIEKEWLASKDKKSIIKKYSLAPGISSIRAGELKLGIKNELNGKKSFAALDTDGKLIIVSGTASAPKIRYVK